MPTCRRGADRCPLLTGEGNADSPASAALRLPGLSPPRPWPHRLGSGKHGVTPLSTQCTFPLQEAAASIGLLQGFGHPVGGAGASTCADSVQFEKVRPLEDQLIKGGPSTCSAKRQAAGFLPPCAGPSVGPLTDTPTSLRARVALREEASY